MLSARARTVAADPAAHTRAELIEALTECAHELERAALRLAQAESLRTLGGVPPVASPVARPAREVPLPQWRDAPRLRSSGDGA